MNEAKVASVAEKATTTAESMQEGVDKLQKHFDDIVGAFRLKISQRAG